MEETKTNEEIIKETEVKEEKKEKKIKGRNRSISKRKY